MSETTQKPKYEIVFTDKDDPDLKVRKSQNFGNGVKIADPDAPATDRQIKLLIKLGYKGKIPKSTGHADYFIKKEMGTLEQHQDIKKKYEIDDQ